MMHKAFTLIELLIVVTIISTLAAIAVPNYLEAQVRAKVVRAKSDMRSVVVSLEAYRVDSNYYPYAVEVANPSQYLATGGGPVQEGMLPPDLTTPVAYIHHLPRDPFPAVADGMGESVVNPFHYLDRKSSEERGSPNILDDYHEACWGVRRTATTYWVLSVGPDLEHDRVLAGTGDDAACLYDPTNGTVSSGDMFYFQGTGLR